VSSSTVRCAAAQRLLQRGTIAARADKAPTATEEHHAGPRRCST
jgi:hypothetical protein